MIFPFTFLLWALMNSSGANTVQQPTATSCQTQSVVDSPVSDSAFFKLLDRLYDRYSTISAPEKVYLQFDRSFFTPGESLWFNAWIVQAGNLKNTAKSQVLYVELTDLRGHVLETKKLLAMEGIVAGAFSLPPTLAGGRYRIRAFTLWMMNTGEEFVREITVQKSVLPRLNLKLEFERKAHGPGEAVVARFDASSLDNQAIKETSVSFKVLIDGEEAVTETATTDENGRAYLRFNLPTTLSSTDALLQVEVEHNAQKESISRPVPIVLNKIDLQFFAEGGDALPGVENKIAFKALNEFGKPADVEGHVLNSRKEVVAHFRSFHQGMGAFDFTPEPGETYTAALTRPISTEPVYALPQTEPYGMSLRLESRTENELVFKVSGRQVSKCFLAGESQDKIFIYREIDLSNNGQKLIRIDTRNLAMGIARFTLFNENYTETAERLVFVNRNKGLHIDIKTDKEKYLPRDYVRVDIQVSDHLGRPVAGHFALSVADEKLLTFADDKQGHLLSSLLLEQDVKGAIEEPNFYFDPKETKADEALDHLLLTQGWRRFEWKKVFNREYVSYRYPVEEAAISGYLVRTDGSPVVKTKLSLYPSGPETQTDEQGFFKFSRINPDWYSYLKLPKNHYFRLETWTPYPLKVVVNGSNNTSHLQPNSEQPSANGATVVRGTIVDDAEPLIGATIKLSKNGEFVHGAVTNMDGVFNFNIYPGVYDIEIYYTGYQPQKFNEVRFKKGKINQLPDIFMTAGQMLSEVAIVNAKISQAESKVWEQPLQAEQIRNLPTRNLNAMVAIDGNDVTIRGSRSDAINYYIDGIRVTGAPIPVQDLDNEQFDPPMGTSADRSTLQESVVIVYRKPMVRADEMSDITTFSKDELVPRSSAARRTYYVPSGPPSYYRAPMFTTERQFYAPIYGTQSQAYQRTDFRSTIYWNPSIKTDQSGKASVYFSTSDAITNFRITVEGLATQGTPGRAEQHFYVQKPISISVKTPYSVCTGDTLLLELVLSNHTDKAVSGAVSWVKPAHFQWLPEADNRSTFISYQLAARETRTYPLKFKIGFNGQDQLLLLKLTANELLVDELSAMIKTIELGFPVKNIIAGNDTQKGFQINLQDPIDGTVNIQLKAYPNLIQEALSSMERMLRQPSGCFEQVSSSNYPNVLVLDILHQTNQMMPDVETRTKGYLELGYAKLTGYECKNGGFDWYGRDPGHEGLTAYGVLQFTDMSKVYPVDKKMIERTVRWLADQSKDQTSWSINPEHAHGWQNDDQLSAYIIWALAEAGYAGKFQAHLKSAREKALKSNDPYQIALVTNALFAAGDPSAAAMLKKLMKFQKTDGSWEGKTRSVFHGTGACLQIETTALAALALLKTKVQSPELGSALNYILKSKTTYGYGSTQSTVLALKAILGFVKLSQQKTATGVMIVRVDQQEIGRYKFSSQDVKPLQVNHLERFLHGNSGFVEVLFENDGNLVPFDIELNYSVRMPDNAPSCPLGLQTTLRNTRVSTGETVRLEANMSNTSSEHLASPMMVIGIPAGLSLQPWQLKKLLDEKQCDFYELWDGYAVFHFDGIDAHSEKTIHLDLRADIPGVYEAPASQAFLYYSNDQRVWSKPERMVVQ